MNPKKTSLRRNYIESLEPRIAPATIIVTSLLDNGDGTKNTLREAIDSANAAPDADTIIFAKDLTGTIVLNGTELLIKEALTIKGPGAGKLIIDAGDLSRIFRIDDANADPSVVKTVSISGLSMVDGNAGTGAGGGIFSAESLSLSNVVISSGRTTGDGGGVAVKTAGKVSVKNSIISGNKGSDGGGLYLRADGGVQVTGSTISGNIATGRGGGLYAHVANAGTGDIVVDNCKIVANSAFSGAGLSLDNDRDTDGTQAGKVTVKNSIVSGNIAGARGGGLYLDDGFVLLDRVQISNNVAADEGGGLNDNSSDSLTIKSSTIINNRTTDAGKSGGGGIFVAGDSKVVIQSTTISGNTSASDGGGISSRDSTVLLKSSTVSGNTATDDGGGLFGFEGSSLTVESSLFFDNHADQGGGLRAEGTTAGSGATELTIKSSTFRGNRAENSGGAVDTTGDGTVAISTSKFIGNSTVGDAGGGMYLRSSAAIVITSSTITHNAGGIGGGGVALSGSGAKSIVGTLIRDNIAITGDGGGIVLLGTGILTLSKTTSVLDNVAENAGGGIFNATADATKLFLKGSKVISNTSRTAPQISGPFTP